MHSEFRRVSEIISKEKEFKIFRKSAKEYEVMNIFYDVFPELKKVVKVKKIKDGILTLIVENSVWRSELKFRQNSILEKLNCYINSEVVNKIRFTSK
ncbi:MAG: DUF721 domain-containing protein [Ignavibacteria bacterium]|jgi:hypothetical protein